MRTEAASSEMSWKLGISVSARTLLALVGGYVLSAEILSHLALGFTYLMPRSEAVVLTAMLGFAVYLGVLLWAFSEQKIWRLWLILLGGPIIAYGGTEITELALALAKVA